ncbi:MAG: hypothetical protein HOV80_03685 [Polyangiaceae bacterium]|nr:hypothetical protein [Polyangiaceae bacterium]
MTYRGSSRPHAHILIATLASALAAGCALEVETDPNGEWTDEVPLDQAQKEGYSPRVAVGADGSAVVVWTDGNVALVSYADGKWSGVTYIGVGGEPNVALDQQNDPIVVFTEGESASTVWANRYVAGSGWLGAEQLDGGPTCTQYLCGASEPQIAMSPRGGALAVWVSRGPEETTVWARPFDAATGWGTPEALDTLVPSGGHRPRVGFDAAGNAVVVWVGTPTSTEDDAVRSARYEPGVGWTEASTIMSSSDNYVEVELAVSASGDAFAIVCTDWRLSAARYDHGSGWGEPELLMDELEGAMHCAVGADAAGGALVLWESKPQSIWSRTFSPGSGWEPKQPVEDSDGDAANPSVAVAPDGRAVAVWEQDNGRFTTVHGNRYEPGSGWKDAIEIEAAFESGRSIEPQLGINEHGLSVAVWQRGIPSAARDNHSIWAGILP